MKITIPWSLVGTSDFTYKDIELDEKEEVFGLKKDKKKEIFNAMKDLVTKKGYEIICVIVDSKKDDYTYKYGATKQDNSEIVFSHTISFRFLGKDKDNNVGVYDCSSLVHSKSEFAEVERVITYCHDYRPSSFKVDESEMPKDVDITKECTLKEYIDAIDSNMDISRYFILSNKEKAFEHAKELLSKNYTIYSILGEWNYSFKSTEMREDSVKFNHTIDFKFVGKDSCGNLGVFNCIMPIQSSYDTEFVVNLIKEYNRGYFEHWYTDKVGIQIPDNLDATCEEVLAIDVDKVLMIHNWDGWRFIYQTRSIPEQQIEEDGDFLPFTLESNPKLVYLNTDENFKTETEYEIKEVVHENENLYLYPYMDIANPEFDTPYTVVRCDLSEVESIKNASAETRISFLEYSPVYKTKTFLIYRTNKEYRLVLDQDVINQEIPEWLLPLNYRVFSVDGEIKSIKPLQSKKIAEDEERYEYYGEHNMEHIVQQFHGININWYGPIDSYRNKRMQEDEYVMEFTDGRKEKIILEDAIPADSSVKMKCLKHIPISIEETK